MNQAIGELLPLGVAISISPLAIIAMVVLLMSSRARTSTPAFMLGWVAAVAAVLAASAALTEVFGGRLDDGPSPAISVVKLLLRAGMLYLAFREWHTRPKPGQEAELPRWLTSVQNMRPLAAAAAGFGIYGANPKNLTVGVSAGVLFHSFGLPRGPAVLVGAIYVLVASSTVVVPILAFLLAEDKVKPWLDELKGWLTQHNAAVMAVLLSVIGALMVGKAIAGL
jgi:Sap, sulfolipid-1-addressing protein